MNGRRDIAGHRAWMIRGYAIGQGAGTQFVTGMCWAVATGGRPEEGMPKAVLLAASWGFNILLAEWLIRRRPATAGKRLRAAASAS